jgi:predicted nuclease of predicted toxin-antitoxin system
VKLLFDENLSPRLAVLLATDFPSSEHIDHMGLHGATDQAVWDFAKANGFTIVSKDNDFRQRSFLSGHPPKVVWLSVGNAGTSRIEFLLSERREVLELFLSDSEESLYVLEDREV